MKIIFAGTPEFSATVLRAIIAADHQVALVLTHHDRPSGRGMVLNASPVKALAQASGIEVYQPQTLKDAAAQERVRAVGAEARGAARVAVEHERAIRRGGALQERRDDRLRVPGALRLERYPVELG